MSAIIRPLKGKYYGTVVEGDFMGQYFEVVVWLSGDEQSIREDITDEEIMETGENHYENVESFELAKLICDAINKGVKE